MVERYQNNQCNQNRRLNFASEKGDIERKILESLVASMPSRIKSAMDNQRDYKCIMIRE